MKYILTVGSCLVTYSFESLISNYGSKFYIPNKKVAKVEANRQQRND